MPIGAEIKKQQRSRGMQDALASKPNSGVITSINSQTEEVLYRTGIAGSRTPVTHPYLGPNSWLRVMPERGTKCMIARRAEDSEPYISAYISEGTAAAYTNSTEENQFYYRSLREGEIDMATPGVANLFLARRGNVELRGGTTSIKMHADGGEIQSRAPTQVRQVFGNKRQEVGDEERFGVVQRPGAKNVKFPGQPTIRNIVETLPTFFAKEYLRILRSDGPIPGVTLIEHREGDVYDDSGLPILSTKTGRTLRSRTKYGTSLPGVSTDVEIDVDGNIAVTLPTSAVQGMQVNVLGPGDVKFTVGKDLVATVLKSIILSASTIDMKALVSTTIKGPILDVKTLLVNLGKGASHPGVHGDSLIAWLLSHNHPTAVGPSGPPIVPPPPTMLSTTVKLS